LHLMYKHLRPVLKNVRDLLDLWEPYPGVLYKKNGHLRILIFNWRDTKHKWAGGAEIYVHELAKRWVKMGHKVTVFCGNDGRSARFENIDGVKIVRRGGFYMSYFWAFVYYVFRFRKHFDVIIDSENGIPYFAPLYSRVPVIGLIHHVHSEIILKELKLPFFKMPAAFIAMILESKIMPFVYRNCQMVAVSPSTKKDMEKLGFGKNKPIQIIYPGVDLKAMKPGQKSAKPTTLYLGRLMPYKSIDTLIKAVKIIAKKISNVKLKIAGFGESREHLEHLARKMGIENKVVFLGKVSESEKIKLMGSAWVFAYPSTMEGWGISIIEANACGTPVVASNVPGLRDSVRNPSSGHLVPKQDSEAFAQKIEEFLTNSKLRHRFEKGALKWAQRFDWSNGARDYIDLIEKMLKNK
jgi:glycosyltransferase involved in cell wall biosynthesis